MKIVSMLLIFAMVLCLWGCGNDAPPTTTTPAIESPTLPDPGCVHQYADADCLTPKTCTLCGHTRGSALDHDYSEGACTRCGAADASYTALTDGHWRMDALTDDGSQLEYITLRFDANGTVKIGVDIYGRLSDIPAEEREAFMLDAEKWYDYGGEIYYYAQCAYSQEMTYVTDGGVITCSITADGEEVASLILERSAGSRLTITYLDGDLVMRYPQVGNIFGCDFQ